MDLFSGVIFTAKKDWAKYALGSLYKCFRDYI